MAFAVNSGLFHVYLTSDGCLGRFPLNRPNDFWIGLQNEKILGTSRRWSVGIQNIHFDSDLYNFGPGSGVSFMFLYEGEYHVVHPQSDFVSTPSEAVEALNAALRKYCHSHRTRFKKKPERSDDPKKEQATNSVSPDDLATSNTPFPKDVSLDTVSQQEHFNHDKDLEEELEEYNDIVFRGRPVLDEHPEESIPGSLWRNADGSDTPVKIRIFPRSGRGKRAVPEQSNSGVEGGVDVEKLLKFFVDEKSGKVMVNVGVRDFAMSQMLRLMLGFHSRKKVFEEAFEFRRKCRLFFKPFSQKFDFVKAVEDQAQMLHPIQIKKSRPEDRDRLYMDMFDGWGYDRFLEGYGHLLEPTLRSLLSGSEAEYEAFVEESYFPARRGPVLTFGQRNVPFSIYSMIDFLYYVIAWKAVDGKRLDNLSLVADRAFKPHTFDRLFVYSNIVKPVDYDDRQLRLMDVIFLQPKSGGNYGVVDYRSVVFQEVDVDVLKDIHIIVTTSLGSPAPFMHGPMCLTLQFRKEN